MNPTGSKDSPRPNVIRLFERGEVKVIDRKAGRVEAVVSTETRDRDGDIIRQAGWDLDNFMKNPVMLDSHRYGSLEAVIGRWDSMEVKGKKLIGEATYRIGRGQQNADIAFDIAKDGGAAFSVGFIPDMSKAKEIDGKNEFFQNFEFNGQQLLEVSQVSVPSNPDAMQRMIGLHPLIDDMIAEKLITITIDDDKGAGPQDDDELRAFLKGIGLRMDDLEQAMAPLVKLLHTHPGGPEPDVDADDPDRDTKLAKLILKAGHGEHDADGNGSHDHDGGKAISPINYREIFREAIEEALTHG